MDIQICYLTNDAFDTIALTHNGVVVSQWTVDGVETSIAQMSRPGDLSKWAVHDGDGLNPLSEYGDLLAKAIQIGDRTPLTFINQKGFEERVAFWSSEEARS